MKVMEEKYQGVWDYHMIAEYYWYLFCDLPEYTYKRKLKWLKFMLTILNDRLILIDDKIKEILLDDPRSTEAQINDEMELCETYSLQVGIVAQKVKEYESKLAAPCDDKMSQSSTSDVKRQIKLPKFELKKYTGELEEWLSWWSHFEKNTFR
ncbi:hypothetical protein LAZ67_7002312 [Cordylochernes scorpioides]|uniref:Uncharacterized protein n=1 Tax=Cordylochernes scorpioides TaxID=51811 RepID=A0ABY6KQ10_9ARAC|nr:hypothetical protein LAZ67_7002312 [Cordylochernes scorpioides]